MTLRALENMNAWPWPRVASDRPAVDSRTARQSQPSPAASSSNAHSVGLPLKTAWPPATSGGATDDSSIVQTATSVPSSAASAAGICAASKIRAPTGFAASASPLRGSMAGRTQPATHAPRTVMRFAVSVPVLSEQIVVAEPMVSHAFMCLTRLLSSIILPMVMALQSATARGRPSGTATTRIVTATRKKRMIEPKIFTPLLPSRFFAGMDT
mmetsp:Transcript_20483/g.67652  ORF Transcript_20483/g.67652 Transcript_20483/m.67652 type:complete len:212 (+) Transcript_20483:1570-2205(+)